ncbi:hypothetical protein CBM2599_A30126 [Cupriavidus taiwanensis]|nr:hypothetical protein CBM2599_A30126 [Cupriavidus taiwanensis]SOY88719.1 hypothetical protein CBM2600_A40029 [Cupriavidus taiwanensis]
MPDPAARTPDGFFIFAPGFPA